MSSSRDFQPTAGIFSVTVIVSLDTVSNTINIISLTFLFSHCIIIILPTRGTFFYCQVGNFIKTSFQFCCGVVVTCQYNPYHQNISRIPVTSYECPLCFASPILSVCKSKVRLYQPCEEIQSVQCFDISSQTCWQTHCQISSGEIQNGMIHSTPNYWEMTRSDEV